MLIQLLANGLVSGCLYALIALGFALIYNATRTFHLAHGAVYTASAYFLYVFLILLKWPLWLALLISAGFTLLLGMAMEYLIYAPLKKRNASLLIALISSIGAYTVIINLIAMVFGNETKILRPGIEVTYTIGNIILTRIQLAEVIVFLIITPVVIYLLKKTSWGKSVRAVSDHPQLASVMGIKLSHVRYSVFAVGSVLAGIAAMLSGLDTGMDPYVGMPMFLIAAVAMIVGGVGTFAGAVVGAFLIGVVESLVIWQISARWVEAITFVILILFLIFKPEGLLGKRKRIEEAVIQ